MSGWCGIGGLWCPGFLLRRLCARVLALSSSFPFYGSLNNSRVGSGRLAQIRQIREGERAEASSSPGDTARETRFFSFCWSGWELETRECCDRADELAWGSSVWYKRRRKERCVIQKGSRRRKLATLFLPARLSSPNNKKSDAEFLIWYVHLEQHDYYIHLLPYIGLFVKCVC